jgi:predicted DNA-binding transcriptional regulator YafY
MDMTFSSFCSPAVLEVSPADEKQPRCDCGQPLSSIGVDSENVIETSARLLRLLGLLQARRFWSGGELAERLEVTERTLRRDVDRLRTLGYPVHSAAGVAGGYQLGTGAALPPLLLEDDEALAVALGLRSAAAGSITGIEEAAVRALAKLEQVLPARLRRRIKALHTAVVPLHRAGPRIDPELLANLANACRSEERLTFRYAAADGAESDRSLEPHGLVHAGSRWYLVAWDLGREDWRTFRVDRICGKAAAGRRFVPRKIPHGDVASFVSRSLSTSMYAFAARVRLAAPLASVAERVSPLAGKLSPLDAQHCLLETGGHSLSGLGMFIAMLGVEFEVLDPPELTQHLRELVERLQRAVANSETKFAPQRSAR